MGNSSDRALEAMRIKEAKGEEISLNDIVRDATAIVPKYHEEHSNDTIVIKVGDKQTDRIPLGPIPSRKYEFEVPKAWLLDHAGTAVKLKFSYTLYLGDLNRLDSDFIEYTITH
ncbi:hypothetical protein ACIP86_23495 [Pseudomonas neuropathica]